MRADTAEAVEVAARVLGPRARRDVPLGQFTTYRVGGPAALMLRVEDVDDLRLAARAVAESAVEVLVIGRGSNLLVADTGFLGLALMLGDEFSSIDVLGTTVSAGASASLPVVARRTVAAGLTGFEWAVGVPGSIGGAVRMNAGGHGSDMGEVLSAATLFDLGIGAGSTAGESSAPVTLGTGPLEVGPHEVGPLELGLGYRSSEVRALQVVVSAELRLAEGDRTASEAKLVEITRWRRDNQPGGANAGSVFANPPGDSAGRLIEEVGCKGLRRGSAFVSPKHANFFQADHDGSAADVLALMEHVREAVRSRLGVVLEPEVRLVGHTLKSQSELEI